MLGPVKLCTSTYGRKRSYNVPFPSLLTGVYFNVTQRRQGSPLATDCVHHQAPQRDMWLTAHECHLQVNITKSQTWSFVKISKSY